MTPEYGWEKLYQAAVLETDWSRIEDHIKAADSAINQRLNEFSLNHGGTPEENLAITKALTALEGIRKDVAAWKLKQR
jgi:hypothetical protein